MKNFILIFIITFAFLSCKKEKATKLQCPPIASCVQAAIDSSLAASPGTYYREIVAYEYQDKYVYLYVEGCCDRFNGLRDENCRYLFSPSGGVAGCGDCTHPDFFNEARMICSLWRDARL